MDKYEEKYLKYKYKYINLVHSNNKAVGGKAANKALSAMPKTISHKYINLIHANNKVGGGKTVYPIKSSHDISDQINNIVKSTKEKIPIILNKTVSTVNHKLNSLYLAALRTILKAMLQNHTVFKMALYTFTLKYNKCLTGNIIESIMNVKDLKIIITNNKYFQVNIKYLLKKGRINVIIIILFALEDINKVTFEEDTIKNIRVLWNRMALFSEVESNLTSKDLDTNSIDSESKIDYLSNSELESNNPTSTYNIMPDKNHIEKTFPTHKIIQFLNNASINNNL